MTEQLWLAILSSSVISGVLGALIAGTYALRSKHDEYVNEYFKTVIHRRLAAYEQLESLIVALKTAVLESDNKPYHLLFSKEGDWETAHSLLFNVMSQGIWMSEDAFEKTRDLNYLVFRLNPSESSVIEFGKANYETIATLRVELETILATDMLTLHDVKGFLKRKMEKNHAFHLVRLHG